MKDHFIFLVFNKRILLSDVCLLSAFLQIIILSFPVTKHSHNLLSSSVVW